MIHYNEDVIIHLTHKIKILIIGGQAAVAARQAAELALLEKMSGAPGY